MNPNDVDAHQVSVRSGIAEECAARGHRLVMSSTPDVDSEEAVLRRVVEQGAHGVIVYLRDHSRAGPTLFLAAVSKALDTASSNTSRLMPFSRSM